MLMPKRVKYRKQMRGRMKGKASRGAEVHFGDFGLQAVEPGWVTARQIAGTIPYYTIPQGAGDGLLRGA